MDSRVAPQPHEIRRAVNGAANLVNTWLAEKQTILVEGCQGNRFAFLFCEKENNFVALLIGCEQENIPAVFLTGCQEMNSKNARICSKTKPAS